MRNSKASLMGAAFIAATSAFAAAPARAEGGAAAAQSAPSQAESRVAVQNGAQNGTQEAAHSPSAPLQQSSAPAQDAAAADTKNAGQGAKQDGEAPAQASSPAPAQTSTQANASCPGNPNALGTSRILPVDPAAYKEVGRMQYTDSLPLRDKEVVITFDDGPLPPYSNQILDILASECVKVTYFLVGEMARAYPAVVRREYEEGHTIGTHSEHHPLHFGELPLDRMRSEIDVGISDVGAALGDTKYLAPFFRIPGLDRSATLEEELAARHLIVFSSDIVADDWRHISPEQIRALALKRLEARGKGILLLHDIHPKTVAALPGILKDLKDNGFHVVQVVPSASYEIAMANKPKTQALASAIPGEINLPSGLDEAAAKPAWPQPVAESPPPDASSLPAPDASAFQPDAIADESTNVQWPEQPETMASSDEGGHHHGQKISGRTRHKNHDADSDARERHHRHHEREHAGRDRHRADLTSKIETFANLFTPTH